MRRVLTAALILAFVGAIAFVWLTAPRRADAAEYANLTGKAAAGEAVFWATGCASCHMAPGASGDAQMILAGGQRFVTGFGTFHSPNISPDPDQGTGGWTLTAFASAVTRGVSPEGAHYYPAFPYAAYRNLAPQEVADLKAYIDTLPASAAKSLPHELAFPLSIRRLLGGWKLLFATEGWVVPDPLSPVQARGRHLAEAMAHCGECHTPRNALGGLIRSRWMQGAPNPSGKGTIPGITPSQLDWSETEIAEMLATGFTPEYDSVGGSMAHVVENFVRLTQDDRNAVAAYLKIVPPAD